LTDKVSYPWCFFVLNSPIPTPHLLTLRKWVTCRWAFETPHKSKGSREHHSPLLSVLALSQQEQVTAFSLVFDEVLIAKKLCCFLLVDKFSTSATKFITKAIFLKNKNKNKK
jgi:hypothetical protein